MLILGGCRTAETPKTIARSRPDVIVITVDTLRADRVSKDVTPAIEAIGRAGTIFMDATAHAPLTLPSHISILTGRYPVDHGVHDNNGFALSDSVPTLATILRSAGYHTAAFVSSFVVRAATGLGRDFEQYDDHFAGVGRTHLTTTSLERGAAETAGDAVRWLKNAPRPFFLWVHFYDPHAPYDPPPAFARKFPGHPYDGEVAAADFGVSMVVEALSPERRAATVVVVTGDHGESLGEHGEAEHGVLLYDATLHVPLVIQGPGISAGGRVLRQVRHVDLLPTIADLVGVPPPAALDGISLVPLLGGQTRTEAPPSYAESRFAELHFGWSPIHSLRDGSWKYIDGPDPELYRLSADPNERENQRPGRPDTASGMGRALATLVARTTAPAGPASAPDAAERLRSLGYVSGRVDLGAGAAGEVDPKREIARYQAYVEAFNASLASLETGRAHDAEIGFRKLAREFPRAFEAHQYLARALAARHATIDAVAEFDLAIQLSPREAAVYFDAARTLADDGQFDRAFVRVAEGRRLEPASFYGALTEGVVARAAGQNDRAERAFRAAVQMNPTLGVAHVELGQLAESRGDRDAARREYRLALDGDSSIDAARRGLERVGQ